ncbi:unnamed protein product [Anisakis simplex]|uniref:Hypoxia up-regulated protein 1 n=1 Tax=Anisakis simplex TaxID=6269 RepID=A0A0M3JRX0_ANISI|nr:unnamed protein product [Anisakis simplex]
MKTRMGQMVLLLFLIGVFGVYLTDASLAALSIDFGSQYMKIALVKPGVPMEIVLNKESRRKTPNLVAFRNGERFFGDAALATSVKYPHSACGFLLDILGKKFDNQIVSLYKRRFPHLNITADEERGTVQFVIVEMLIAMVLSYARKTAEDFAEQPIRDAIITVPAYFNQAERLAMVAAAEMAGINLLQLMNAHSAAALNYGVFRIKEIKEQDQTMLIYDMGASKTTAAIVSYNLEKDKHSSEKNPRLRTLGFGFDRTLGGLEITLRLRDHLVQEFRKTIKTKKDIATNQRAMAKMLKEAERLKQVLSANADHFAQVESIHEDHDFKVRVTRAQLEDMMTDLEPRMIQPINDALKMAEMDIGQLDQVVLMGAGTRVPRVKAVLQQFLENKELGNFLNTDEAIAMGAVYESAHLSKGFKVKRFDVYDLLIFPIQVLGMYNFCLPTCHLEFGSLNVSDIEMTGIAEAVRNEMADEGTTLKKLVCEEAGNVLQGVKVRFSMDGSGIVHVEGAEVVFEKTPKEQSAFASIAGKFAGFFSSRNDDKVNEEVENKKDESKKVDDGSKENKKTEEKVSKKEEQTNDKERKKRESKDESEKTEKSTTEPPEKPAQETVNDKAKETESKKEEKPKTVKIALKLKETRLDLFGLPSERMASAKKLLSDFDEREHAKEEREAAQNNLESLVYDTADKLEQSEYQMFFTNEEQTAVSEQLKVVRTWLEDEADFKTTTEEFESKRKSITDLLKPIKSRMKEHKVERPIVVSELLSLFNHTELFLKMSENLTAANVFSEVEITTLNKAFNETKIWWNEKNATQLKLKPNEQPAYTVQEVVEKMRNLDREVKYLLNKMKFAKPKTETVVEPKGNTTNETDSAKPPEQTDNDSAEGVSHLNATDAKDEKSATKEPEVTTTENITEDPSAQKETTSENAPDEAEKSHDTSEL